MKLDFWCSNVHNRMVVQPYGYAMSSPSQIDLTFAALADPTRRGILVRLATGEASVKELARPFAMSQPAVSKHLKVLERAGLITRGQDAQRRPRRIQGKGLGAATEWLQQFREFWDGSFQRLDDLLEEMKATERRKGRRKGRGKKS